MFGGTLFVLSPPMRIPIRRNEQAATRPNAVSERQAESTRANVPRARRERSASRASEAASPHKARRIRTFWKSAAVFARLSRQNHSPQSHPMHISPSSIPSTPSLSASAPKAISTQLLNEASNSIASFHRLSPCIPEENTTFVSTSASGRTGAGSDCTPIRADANAATAHAIHRAVINCFICFTHIIPFRAAHLPRSMETRLPAASLNIQRIGLRGSPAQFLKNRIPLIHRQASRADIV